MKASLEHMQLYPDCGEAQFTDVASIVNGVDADAMLPWAAVLTANRLSRDGAEWVVNQELMSGSLMSDKHVLTAAHSLCRIGGRKNLECTYAEEGTRKLFHPNTKQEAAANPTAKTWFVEVTVANLPGDVEPQDAQSVQIHENYVSDPRKKPKKYDEYDLALVTILGVAAVPDFIPICLPGENFTKQEVKDGIFSVTYGFGLARDANRDDNYDSCMTTRFSTPKGRYKKCLDACITDQFWPRFDDCFQAIGELRDQQGKTDYEVELYEFRKRAGHPFYCPNPAHPWMQGNNLGPHGWCHTDQNNNNIWGLCSSSCRFQPGDEADTLQLAKVQVKFGARQCQENVLYASVQLRKPKMEKYRMGTTSDKWTKEGSSDGTLDKYGIISPCDGDSGGGSYFLYTDSSQTRRAVLVGQVVTSHKNCATIRAREELVIDVYVEIYSKLDWIFSKID